MGKKRNNAAKKKQVAKKKKLSSAYGVSVSKGGTIARNNGVILDARPISDGGSRAKKGNVAATKVGGSTKSNDRSSTTNCDNTRDNMSCDTGKRSRGGHGENDEFQLMHASLEERSLASQARKDDLQKCRKERLNKQKKGWGNFARPSATNFAPATLTLAPKTTQELMDDAAEQVARGMNEIGQRAASVPSDGATAMPGQSTLASAASLNWKLRVSNVSNQAQQQSQNQDNPFAALDEDSDSDNEWADKKAKVVQQFQFQAASFSFQQTISAPQVEGPSIGGDDDFDPDL